MKQTFDFCGEGRPGNRRTTRERSCPAGQHRVLRGASWNNNDRVNLRSSYRNNDHPMNRDDNNGFRCVLVVAGGKAPMRPKDRRDAAPGQNPLAARAKREPKPGGFSLEKTGAWGGHGCGHERGLAIPAAETHSPRQGKDAVPARGHAKRVITGVRCSSFSLSSHVPSAPDTLKREQRTLAPTWSQPSTRLQPCVRSRPACVQQRGAVAH